MSLGENACATYTLIFTFFCSAVLGYHCHSCGRCFTHRDVLLLHRQEMLLQKEEEQEGQKGEG